jgi:acrylyl-CoA reductase (NADPH)
MDELPAPGRGLWVERANEQAALRVFDASSLPPGDTVVAVSHSGLNYKDALAVSGRPGVLRSHPIITGIDLAGRVLSGGGGRLRVGDQVFATGRGLGEERCGGHATLARLPGDWLQAIPAGFSAAWAMGLGTAGLTAALAIDALEDHGLRPQERAVLVSGAGGGVGSLSVILLAAAGYRVAAVSGRPELGDWLRGLGAAEVLARAVPIADAAKPLAGQRWAGGVDAVGGTLLAGMLSATAAGGAVAACGLAGGAALPTSVLPFILRGVALLGIESVRASGERRARAWARLHRDLPPARLAGLVREIDLAEVPALAGELLAGRVRGRLLVRTGG